MGTHALAHPGGKVSLFVNIETTLLREFDGSLYDALIQMFGTLRHVPGAQIETGGQISLDFADNPVGVFIDFRGVEKASKHGDKTSRVFDDLGLTAVDEGVGLRTGKALDKGNITFR